MGWATIVGLAFLTLALLWLLKVRGSMLTVSAGAVALGCAGYALQGSPGLAGVPTASARPPAPLPLTGARHAMMGQFDYSDTWLNLADSLASRGNTENAARLLGAQVARHPGDYKLWVGLGNALTDHAQTVTPAARLAFERAIDLAPDHPAPRFFYGLALLRSGDPASARALWQDVLARAPADASWRPLVEDGLAALGGAQESDRPQQPPVQQRP